MGFYVKPGQGHRTHDGHPVLQETGFIHPSKAISPEDKEMCRKIVEAYAPVASAMTLLTKSTKRNYNYHQIRYICSLEEAIKKKNIQGSLFSAHDKLVMELQELELPYILLKSTVNQSNGLPSLHTDFMKDNLFNTEDGQLSLPSDEHMNMTNFIKEQRSAMNLSPTQDMLIGIAWVNPLEISFAKMYPEVFFIDVTCKTNNEKLPLLTVTGKTALNKMFTLLRAYLPNQRAWIFRWVFSIVLPHLIPQHVLKRTTLAISDGYYQEYTQLDAAIATHLPQCVRGRCGWHIVDRGWKTHCPMDFKQEKKGNQND